MRAFWSDNCAPTHPRMLRAISDCNEGHAASYGDDEYTLRASEAINKLFGRDCESIFVMNGTGANVVALSPMLNRYGAIVCAQTAHINTHETGAPCSMLGAAIVPVPTPDGKLTPERIEAACKAIGDTHMAQPQCVEIAQVTELGTVYTPTEVRALADFAHARGMYLMMDGARLSTALAALNAPITESTCDAGVDTLVFGGTKNGLMMGECVICFNDALKPHYPYLRKNLGQLASKMRYITAQFAPYIEEGLYLETARHANAMAKRLADGLRSLNVEFAYPPQANMVFARIPDEKMALLKKEIPFHSDGPNIARFVASFDTEPGDVDALLKAVKELI